MLWLQQAWSIMEELVTNATTFAIFLFRYYIWRTPSNLYRWYITPETAYFPCSKQVCTLAHILRACRVALQQGRFTFHHDAVLQVLVSSIKSFLTSYQVSKTKFSYIKFPNCGLLHTAPDWLLLYDLESTQVIPPTIAISHLRPDILLYSTSTKTVIILELTCPCEENIESWHATKFGKYDPLSSAIKTNGWSIHFLAVEVGAWGYCAFTIRSCLMRLGLTRKLVRSSLKTLSSAPLTASFQIWLYRVSREWIIPNAADGIISAAMELSTPKPPGNSKSIPTG